MKLYSHLYFKLILFKILYTTHNRNIDSRTWDLHLYPTPLPTIIIISKFNCIFEPQI